MLTPKFKLTQDCESLYLWMHVPYIKYDEADCEVSEGNVLFFSARPYFLRLHLPGDIHTDVGPSSYDVETGDLTINMKKKHPGDSFKGLDMLTWLLTPRKTECNPSIEVLDKSESASGAEKDDGDKNDAQTSCLSDDGALSVEESEIDWFIDQTNPEESLSSLEGKKTGCGFALRNIVFSEISSEASYLIDIKDPNNVSLSERRRLREEQESEKFNVEHYLADLFDDSMVKELLISTFPELTGTDGVSCALNDQEREKLTQLPKREYLIEPEMLPQLNLGLIDLMFAYAYNYRFSHGEENVEADWTIGKLSSTLSWFDSFFNIEDVVIACARRSLCFPLYRHWMLFERVLDDVKTIFMCGKTQILKCLLGILFILQGSEDRYVLNDLYITDYCVWIQTASDELIETLAKDLSTLVISKADVGFKLQELEADAKCLMEDESDSDDDVEDLARRIKNCVRVCGDSNCDSDDDNDTDNDSSSNESGSSDDSTSDEESDDSNDTKDNTRDNSNEIERDICHDDQFKVEEKLMKGEIELK